MSMCWCVFQQLKLPEGNTDSRVCPIVVFRWKNMQSGWEWLLGNADIVLFAQQSGMISCSSDKRFEKGETTSNWPALIIEVH